LTRVEQLEEAINAYHLEMNEQTLILLVQAYTSNNNIIKAEKVFYRYKKSNGFKKIPYIVYRY
jgi:hypothetical protein